jgi:hypothetical protein
MQKINLKLHGGLYIRKLWDLPKKIDIKIVRGKLEKIPISENYHLKINKNTDTVSLPSNRK